MNAWDQNDQKAKPLKEFAEFNKKIREITKHLLDKYDELFSYESIFTREEIKKKTKELKESYQVFVGRKEEEIPVKITLLSFIGVYQERYKNRHTPAYLQHFNGLKNHLEAFQKKSGFKVDFETIGKDFYLQFTDYLKKLGIKPNTIGSQIKKIKTLMNEALEDNLTTNQNHRKKEFKITNEEVDTVYLTEDDIKVLYEMPIEIPSKRKIRDIFVLNCYTGLRHSDWTKVSIKNIDDGKMQIRTHKNNVPVLIPLKPLVLEILERYETIEIPTLQKTNDALKWIGEKAFDQKLGKGNVRKWLQIRTHTARRSFATNAYIAGIHERAIMQITGHKTTESFQKYIRFTKQETADKLKGHSFFS